MSPFDSFTVYNYFSFFNNLKFNELSIFIDLSITNTTLFLFINLLLYIFIFRIYYFYSYFNNKYIYIARNLNNFSIFKYIYNHFFNFFNHIYEYSFLPYIFVSFFFVLFSNIIGIIPYSFTITSQFVITFFLSFTNIFAITLIGLLYNGFIFFNLFIPKGVHLSLLPFICLIEIISYISRIISLSIRLSANMISGHVILTILSSVGFIILPLLFFIYLLEILVAFIQAYVFTVLISIYLHDVINIHSH